MKILVCVKQVNREINPFDASALEDALRVPRAEVAVVSMAPPAAAEMLKSLTRLGGTRALPKIVEEALKNLSVISI